MFNYYEMLITVLCVFKLCVFKIKTSKIRALFTNHSATELCFSSNAAVTHVGDVAYCIFFNQEFVFCHSIIYFYFNPTEEMPFEFHQIRR